MPETMPQNATEAAYIAFAVVDELIRNLVDNCIISPNVVDSVFESVKVRLLQANNLDVNRAAQFITDRMTGKE
jgi:hypothetical protein